MQQQQQTPEVSHIESRRIATRSVQERILRLLRWEELKYCYNKYERGLVYLALITGDDKEAMYFMERSDLFWAWWKHAWTMRDEAFLREFTVGVALGRTMIHPAYVDSAYAVLHDPVALAQESSPPGEAMGASYAEMIGRLNRTVTLLKAP